MLTGGPTSSMSFSWLAWPLPVAEGEADQEERHKLVWSPRDQQQSPWHSQDDQADGQDDQAFELSFSSSMS